MARVVSIGTQDFETLVARNNFYIDKTLFIKEWWESDDQVTLITRPRRFGKTLNMSMLERFFSVKYAEKGEVFENLDIWEEKSPDGDYKYRMLQGTYPVIFLSFAGVKADNFTETKEQILQVLEDLYISYSFLKKSGVLEDREIKYFDRIGVEMRNSDAVVALQRLSAYLYRYYGRKVIILLDEYDTPMQEAYVNGYWKEMVSFTRNLFNNTFKTNPSLERAVMTGVTNLSGEKFAKQTSNGSALAETMFSDLNNLKVITMTSNSYATCFGFTEKEVFDAMDEFDMVNKEEVKSWYDGFIIGDIRDIYNPWSVINFLDTRELRPYWANTSSNALAGRLIRRGDKDIKMQFEDLLQGKTITGRVNEEIIFNQLDGSSQAVWSLLLAAGYLKIIAVHGKEYEFSLTNYEVQQSFENMVLDWFAERGSCYNDFVKALLRDDLKEMNAYMNRMALSLFSSFDGGNHPLDETNPERFYHGFVLGLLVDLTGRYTVTSNRESGFGRYDVMLMPLDSNNNGIILEFKIYDPEDERSLEETVQAALRQIEEKRYEQLLLDSGVPKERIRKYGFAFQGKKVLIGV